MILLFCPSFSSLVFTLHNYRCSEFEVLTHNAAINSFCIEAGISVRFIKDQESLSLKGYKVHRDYCAAMVEDYNNCEILFCFYSFDFWCLYQLLLLRKRCSIYFYNIDYLFSPGYNEEDSIKIPVVNNAFKNWENKSYKNRLFLRFILFLVTGIYFKIFKYADDNYAIGIPPEKCKKLFLPFQKKITPEIFRVNQQKILSDFIHSKIDILFVDSGEEIINYPSPLLNFIKDYSTENKLAVYFKPHPTFPVRFNVDGFRFFEKTFPAELLAGIPKLVIGIASTVMVYYSTNTPVISFFNLVEIEEGDYKSTCKTLLDNLKINCPDNLAALKILFDSYLKRSQT